MEHTHTQKKKIIKLGTVIQATWEKEMGKNVVLEDPRQKLGDLIRDLITIIGWVWCCGYISQESRKHK
jgi:hypothetical protein